MAKKVTMQQIADHLGVSKFAVSKALSGKPGVSPSTRDRIYKAANQLGYFSQTPERFEAAPFSRKASNSGIVVVLFPDIRYQTLESSYWGPIVEGITQELKDNGLEMIVITEFSGDNVLKIINPGSMEGVISIGKVGKDLLGEIGQWGTPLIVVDHEATDIPADSLFINSFDAVQHMTDQLIAMGHRSFQFVGDIHYARSFYDRWLGFRSSLENHDISFNQDLELLRLSENGFYSTEELKRLLISLRQNNGIPSVFVCACDKIAIMTIAALAELGINVPLDCSVTGFDNIEESLKCMPKLTTINVPKERLGKRAVQMLLWRTQESLSSSEKVLMQAEIIFRESTSIPKIK